MRPSIHTERYNLENFKEALRNPSLFPNEIINRLYGLKYRDGIDVMAQEWDNLIILDACRYDYFSRLNYFNGDLTQVVSKGSNSRDFIQENFAGRQFHDTIYITANPYCETLSDDVFYTINTTYSDVDNRYEGFLPETILEETLDVHEKHPNKRLISHFMQPHDPYLGPVADAIRRRIARESNITFRKITEARDEASSATLESSQVFSSLLNAYAEGDIREYITPQELRTVYTENLAIVLKYLEDLLAELDGKTVITADHGELLGEYPEFLVNTYRHMPDSRLPEVMEVPWLELEFHDRREVVAEEPIGFTHTDQDSLNEHLEALGYKA